MGKNKKMPRWTKTLIIISAVFAFIAVAVLGAELWAKTKIRTTIEREAFAVAGTEVKVRVGRVGVSIPAMTVSVRSVTLKSQNNNPSHRGLTLVALDAGVKKIVLRGVGYRKTEGKPALSAKSLIIDTPFGTVVTKSDEEQAATQQPSEKKSFQEKITERLSSVAVDKIEVRNAGLDYVAWTGNENTRAGIIDGRLTMDGFRIDSLPMADRLLFCNAVELAVGTASYGFGAGSMVAEADTVSVDSRGRLSVAAFRLVPQYPKDSFAQQADGKDWTQVGISALDVYGIDFLRLINDRALVVDSVSLGAADIGSYKNKQVYSEKLEKPMVWQTVQGLGLPVDIRKISFDNVSVQYDELSETGLAPGVVKFSHGKGTVWNMTNIVEGHDPYFRVDVSALLMESGQVEARCLFPVSPENDHFEVQGMVGKTDMTAFNPVLEPLMNIRINSGMMNGLDFDLQGSLEQSHIKLTMLYNDMSVSLLKKNDLSQERGFLTFMADDIFIRRDNPGNNGKVRSGEGNHKRDPYKSMYNYMWKSFIPGIIKIVI